MQELAVELSVGDSLVVDDRVLTVIDIDESEVSFRIDPLEDPWPQNLCEIGEPPSK